MMLAVVLLGASAAFAQGASFHYDVSIPDPAAETFHVRGELHGVASDTMTYFFPVWAPGAYDIVNFGAFVRDFKATTSDGRALEVIRPDDNTFRIVRPTESVVLDYVVKDIEEFDGSTWFALSDIEDSSKVAFAVGTALFGYPEGRTGTPHTVTYVPPSGWELDVALNPVKNSPNTFSAVDYDELVDAPVQMGSFQRYEFEVDGIPHIITVKSPVPLIDKVGDELVAATKEVVEMMTDFYGEIPYDRYLFQIYLKIPRSMSEDYGALEHANSSTYLMPFISQAAVVDMLQPVISHEYWHLWSPKRFHVDKLGPFDYQHGPHTTSLWFHEGLTEYYARALLVRNDLRSKEDFLETFGRFVDEAYGTEQAEPITTLSADLTERPLEEIISLYTKGPLLGLMLDAEIRLQTDNKASLDDAFRLFNAEYADHRGDKEFGDDDIVPIIEKATGASVRDFFNRYIAGTEPLPIRELFPKIGITPVVAVDFGLRPVRADEYWRVAFILRDGGAQENGLQRKDTITGFAVNGGELRTPLDLKLTGGTLDEWLAERLKNGESVEVEYIRDGTRSRMPLKLEWAFKRLEVDPNASDKAKKIREGMFGF